MGGAYDSLDPPNYKFAHDFSERDKLEIQLP